MNFIQEKKKPVTLIVKPVNSSQGKGIFITRRLKEIPRDIPHVVQLYKNFPYLIDGKKFDFRIYILVTQVVPDLRCFMFNDGLARFATENYNSSINPDNLMMHLTNYAINKESEKF
jgi:tubulin polyglutamylase TTLL6/13